jgi:NADH-quinone oxidoreductase subunit H
MDRLLGGRDFYSVFGEPIWRALQSAGLPDWLVATMYALVGAVVSLVAITALVMLALWAERRFIARLQDRRGPNRVGRFGLLQSPADILKLFAKENVVPGRADRFLHFLAPVLSVAAMFMTWAVLPWGPGLQAADLNVAVLYLLAFGSVPPLAVVLAGWGSANKYSLFGGMRAVVQYVSYEVPGAIVLLVPVLLASTMSLQGIVSAQHGPMWNWFIFEPVFFVGPVPVPIPVIGFVSFIYYLIAGLAETNRTPFDHVEGDSELTGGYFTEYSGIQWGLFMLSEYASACAICLIAASLFLGGFHTGLGDAVDDLLWPLLPGVLVMKAALLFLGFVWVRGTLPRFRYDQLMQFAWKRMLPVTLFLVGATALWVPFAQMHTAVR